MDEERIIYSLTDFQRPFEAVELQLFKKELIRTGIWRHPRTGVKLRVTRERMDRWVDKFNRMRAAGIRVPFPYDHSRDSRDNAGFVQRLWRDGDSLFARVEVPREEDAKLLGSVIQEVSISVNPNYTDGTGRKWGEVIDHVAAVTYPVVSGQKNFEQENFIESRDARDGKTLRIMPLEKSHEAEPEANGGERMNAEELREIFGLGEDATDENIGAKVREAVAEMENRIVELRAKVDELSPPPAPEEPEEVAAMRRQVAEMRGRVVAQEIEELMRKGKLTPGVKEAASMLLLADGERGTIELSGGEKVNVADQFRRFLASLPDGAACDLKERVSRLRAVARPGGEGPSEDEADRLAKENVALVQAE